MPCILRDSTPKLAVGLVSTELENLGLSGVPKQIRLAATVMPYVVNRLSGKAKQVAERLYASTRGTMNVQYSNRRPNEVRIPIDVKAVDKGYVLTLDNGEQYTFYNGHKESAKTSRGVRIRIDGMKDIEASIKSNSKSDIDMLAAKGAYRNDGTKPLEVTDSHEMQITKMWNRPEEMMKLFEESVLVDKDTNSDEHIDHLRELMTKITSRSSSILNEFKVYVDRTAKSNSGMAQITRGDSALILEMRDSSRAIAQGEMSAAEVFVHEMIHMAVEVARTEKKGIMTEEIVLLAKLHKDAKNKLTWKSLEIDGDEQTAKLLYDQMFNNENSVSEFIALALTNEKVMSVLSGLDIDMKDHRLTSGTFISGLVNVLISVYDKLVGMLSDRKGSNLHEQVLWVADRMMENNSRTAKEVGILDKVQSIVDNGVKKIDKVLLEGVRIASTAVHSTLGVVEDRAGDTLIGQSAGVIKNTGSLLNPYGKKGATREEVAQLKRERTRTASEISQLMDGKNRFIGLGTVLAPEGFIVSMLNYLTEDDDLTTRIEKYGLLNKRIDGARTDTIVTVGAEIKLGLGNISKKEQVALTHAYIETDVQVLLDTYSIEDIKGILTSKDKLQASIDSEYRIIDELVIGEKSRNYMKSQAKGMGRSMATGRSGSSVNTNVFDVLTMRGTGVQLELEEGTDSWNQAFRALDRLATLEAISNTDKAVKDTVKDVDSKGLLSLLAMHKVSVQAALDLAKTNTKAPYPIKGDIKDTSDSGVDVKLGKTDEATVKYMKLQGYKLVEGRATGLKGVGMYSSRTATMASFDKQAAAKINIGKRRHSMMTVVDKSDTSLSPEALAKLDLVIDKSTEAERMRQFDGVVMPEEDGYIKVPGKGDRNSYAVAVDKQLYERVARQDNKAPILLGKMVAEVDEKKSAILLNREIFQTIVDDSLANYTRGSADYIEVGPNARTKGVSAKDYSKEIYESMPKYLRDKITSKPEGQQFIAVRRDLAGAYFGGRAPSLLNIKIPVIGETLDEALRKTAAGSMAANLINVSGKLWKQLVSSEKVDIVLKTPIVFIQNIVSNVVLSSYQGEWPWVVVKQQIALFKETNVYLDQKRRLGAIKVKLSIGEGTKELRQEAIDLERSMKNMFVHKMFEAGMYTSISEDISDSDLTAPDKISKTLGEFPKLKGVLDKVPEIVRDGVNVLYMNSNTKMFGLFAKALREGDFVFRAQRLRYLIEVANVPEDRAMKIVLDEGVNYNKLDSKGLRWLNSSGFLWFSKYFFGANKVLIEKLRDKPLRTIGMMTMVDVANPSDASFVEKNYASMFSTPMDVVYDNVVKHIIPMSTVEVLVDIAKFGD